MLIVTAHIKFSLHTTFLDGSFQAEDERLPGESIEDGVLRVYRHLENAVAILKKEHEGMRGVQEVQYPSAQGISVPPIISYGKHDASPEGVLADINNSQSLEELKSYKLLAANNPDLYKAYCDRLKYLSA